MLMYECHVNVITCVRTDYIQVSRHVVSPVVTCDTCAHTHLPPRSVAANKLSAQILVSEYYSPLKGIERQVTSPRHLVPGSSALSHACVVDVSQDTGALRGDGTGCIGDNLIFTVVTLADCRRIQRSVLIQGHQRVSN